MLLLPGSLSLTGSSGGRRVLRRRGCLDIIILLSNGSWYGVEAAAARVTKATVRDERGPAGIEFSAVGAREFVEDREGVVR